MTANALGSLVTCADLTAAAARDDIVFVDATWSWDGVAPREGFGEKRVPGARLFDHPAASDPNSELHDTAPTAEHFAAHVSKLGVSNDDHVVLYGQGAFSGPARAWFLFRLFGHARVSLLDGGLAAWEEAGLAIEGGAPLAPKATEFTATFVPERMVDVDGMRAALDGETQTVDATPRPVYDGERDAFAGRGGPAEGKPGRIADMPNIATATLVEQGRLKSPDALRTQFADAGVDLEKPAITTCSVGVGASGLAFALHLAGARDVAVFDGAYEGWIAAGNAPR